MVIPDTSVWIEFFKGKDPYFTRLRFLLEHQNVLTTDSIFGELLQGCKNKNEVSFISSYWENLPKYQSPDLFFIAGLISYHHKYLSKGIGLIDAAIISSARNTDSSIWTLDKKLLSVLTKKEIFHPEISPGEHVD